MKTELLEIVRPRMWEALAGYDRLRHDRKIQIVYDCIKRLENSDTDPADASRLVFWAYWDESYYDYRLGWKVDRNAGGQKSRH